ncbi:hypothetical protein Trydic_g15023 [Trypoxylus dichotomus]
MTGSNSGSTTCYASLRKVPLIIPYKSLDTTYFRLTNPSDGYEERSNNKPNSKSVLESSSDDVGPYVFAVKVCVYGTLAVATASQSTLTSYACSHNTTSRVDQYDFSLGSPSGK